MKRTMLCLAIVAMLALAGCGSTAKNAASNHQGAAPGDSDSGDTLQQALSGDSNLP